MLSLSRSTKGVTWKQAMSKFDRPVFVLVLVLLFIALCFGLLVILPIPSEYSTIVQGLQLALFVAMGCWQADARTKQLLPLRRNGIDGRLFFTSLIASMIFILLLITYLVVKRGSVLLAAGSASGFLVPYLMAEQWDRLNELDQERFEPWRIPLNGNAGGTADGEMVSMRFRLALEYFGPEDLQVTMTVPSGTQLGRAFELAIANTSLKDTEFAVRQSAWEFYRDNPRMATRRFMDPLKSVSGNAIRNNSTITAKRIKLNRPE